MKRGNRSFRASVSCALRGVREGLRTQRNLRIQFACAAAAIAVGLWLRLGFQEWATLILAMAAVLASELMNTAIEAAVDLICAAPSEGARRAKDFAAGATLLAALGAALVGLCLFVPHFVDLYLR